MENPEEETHENIPDFVPPAVEPTEMEALRNRSGEVRDSRPLVAFLYDLMRDRLPVGVVETLVQQNTGLDPADDEFVFTNGFLAKYAQDIANRLTGS